MINVNLFETQSRRLLDFSLIRFMRVLLHKDLWVALSTQWLGLTTLSQCRDLAVCTDEILSHDWLTV
jgi:hypothetical protein